MKIVMHLGVETRHEDCPHLSGRHLSVSRSRIVFEAAVFCFPTETERSVVDISGRVLYSRS
jgi:hypothetical protein